MMTLLRALALVALLTAPVVAQTDQPKIYVLGEVTKPGSHPYRPNMTVEVALEAACGTIAADARAS